MDVDLPETVPDHHSVHDGITAAGNEGRADEGNELDADGEADTDGDPEGATWETQVIVPGSDAAGASMTVALHDTAVASLMSAPAIAQEVDLEMQDEQGEDDFLAPKLVSDDGLTAHKIESEMERDALMETCMQERSASAASNSLKASTRMTGKRKLAHGDSPSSTPAPPEDSTRVAVVPLLVPTANPDFFVTRNHPMNKSAFRYTPCGPSPLSTERFPLYRVIQSPPGEAVTFSWEDRSSYVSISADALAITTDKGFRAARANVPVREGAYYFEVIVERGAGDPSGLAKGDYYGPHVRLGVGRRESGLNAPVGFDGYSYGIRDKTGDKVHLSQPRGYGEAFGTGDVVGVYLYLPPRPTPILAAEDTGYSDDIQNPARIVRKRVPIRYKGQLYFESMEYAPSKEMEDLALRTRDPAMFAKAIAEAEQKKKSAPPPGKKKAPQPPVAPSSRPLPTLPGSKLAFFKNGHCHGIAYEDLFDWLPLRQHVRSDNQPVPRISTATAITLARENHHDDGSLGYYPLVSVFGGAIARLNPGPTFRFPPPDDIEALLARSKNRQPAAPTASKPGMGRNHHNSIWRPLCDRYKAYYDEITRYDEIDEKVAIEKYEANLQQYAALAASGTGHPASDGNMLTPMSANSKSGRGSGHAKKKTALSKELSRETSQEITPESAIVYPHLMKLEVEERKATPDLDVQVLRSPADIGTREESRSPATAATTEEEINQMVKMEVDT